MQLDIRGRAITITDAMRRHAERRLGFALRRFDTHLRSAMLWVGDVNGSRGGFQKRCRLAILFHCGTAVVVEETDHDAYFALDRAAERAGAKVRKELEGMRGLRRVTRREPETLSVPAAA